MNYFFLRRHGVGKTVPSEYWFEVIENIRAFPHAVQTERHVCVSHSEATGRIIVDELNAQRLAGVIEGMRRFAWWKDGVEYVGTCGTTLERAIKDLETSPC